MGVGFEHLVTADSCFIAARSGLSSTCVSPLSSCVDRIGHGIRTNQAAG
jgi:hypothetical protein